MAESSTRNGTNQVERWLINITFYFFHILRPSLNKNTHESKLHLQVQNYMHFCALDQQCIYVVDKHCKIFPIIPIHQPTFVLKARKQNNHKFIIIIVSEQNHKFPITVGPQLSGPQLTSRWLFVLLTPSEYVIPINAHCPLISLMQWALPTRENGYLSKSYPEKRRNQCKICN